MESAMGQSHDRHSLIREPDFLFPISRFKIIILLAVCTRDLVVKSLASKFSQFHIISKHITSDFLYLF